MTDTEIWKSIPNYEGYYEISNHGRVRSLDRIMGGPGGKNHLKGKLKSFCLSGPKNKKYYYVNLCKDMTGHLHSVHRLVGLMFVDNPRGLNVLNHIDHNNLNNHHSNLEWCNLRENASHQIKRFPTGVSPYYGKNKTTFEARISINKEVKYLGTFDTEEMASQAYKNALVENNLINKYA